VNTRIILADGAKWVRDSLRLLLQDQSDLELVGEAEDAPTLTDLACRMRPDVVVMDINMPASAGFETVSHLLRTMPDVKVIVMSLQADHRYVEQGFRAGISGYVLKDRAHEELPAAVRTVACDGKFVSPELERRSR